MSRPGEPAEKLAEIDVDATVAAILERVPASERGAEAEVRAEIEALAADVAAFNRDGSLSPRLLALTYGGAT